MKYSYFLISLILIGLSYSHGYAWDDADTHPRISKVAIDKSGIGSFLTKELGFSRGLDTAFSEYEIEFDKKYKNKTPQEWLELGSKVEDKPNCRAQNHFHNPIMPASDWDDAKLTDTRWITDFLCWTLPDQNTYLARDIISNLIWALHLESYVDPDTNDLKSYFNPDINDYDWIDARNYYYWFLTADTTEEVRDGLIAKCFLSLGMLMHLIQDMTVPAHVRNDFSWGHITLAEGTIGNPFENFVAEWGKYNLDWFTVPEDWDWFTNGTGKYLLENGKLSDFWDSDGYTAGSSLPEIQSLDMSELGAAEYANLNFASIETIFTESEDPLDEHYQPFPAKENTDVDTTLDSPPEYSSWDNKMKHYIKKYGKDETNGYGEHLNRFATFPWFSDVPEYKTDPYYSKRLHYIDRDGYTEYAEKLIPKAIGYSAALLKYFFRGKIEITASNAGVYSIIDPGNSINLIDPDDPSLGNGFKFIKANLRNVTVKETDANGDPLSYEDMPNGTLYAIAKYKLRTDYQPDLSNDPPDPDTLPTEFTFKVSKSLKIPDDCELNSETPTEVTFDFTDDPVPVGVTDLYLQVVFSGTLGEEQDTAIAVGMKDLSEPAPFDFWNNTDYFLLDGEWVTAAQAIEHPDIDDEPYVHPHEEEIRIGFSVTEPDEDPTWIVFIQNLPPGRYARIMALTDSTYPDSVIWQRVLAICPDSFWWWQDLSFFGLYYQTYYIYEDDQWRAEWEAKESCMYRGVLAYFASGTYHYYPNPNENPYDYPPDVIETEPYPSQDVITIGNFPIPIEQ